MRRLVFADGVLDMPHAVLLLFPGADIGDVTVKRPRRDRYLSPENYPKSFLSFQEEKPRVSSQFGRSRLQTLGSPVFLVSGASRPQNVPAYFSLFALLAVMRSLTS